MHTTENTKRGIYAYSRVDTRQKKIPRVSIVCMVSTLALPYVQKTITGDERILLIQRSTGFDDGMKHGENRLLVLLEKRKGLENESKTSRVRGDFGRKTLSAR